jgi:hypothetical protein
LAASLISISYRTAIRDAFGARVAHGVINKTYAVTDLRKDAAHRYSPAAVVAVEAEAVIGLPVEISTSYAERSNLSIRMASRRFTRLTNGFSKNLENHAAAVSLYVAHYNLCRWHETIRCTKRKRCRKDAHRRHDVRARRAARSPRRLTRLAHVAAEGR